MFESLPRLCEKHELINHIRGIGLLWGIKLRKNSQPAVTEAGKIMYECLSRGLSFKVCKRNIITLSPSLTIKRKELEESVKILDEPMSNYQ
ncbi:MAG: aminotransferase class III-fold pyridoxal phosphate-dependent enzyme [Bacteroidota bacterium]